MKRKHTSKQRPVVYVRCSRVPFIDSWRFCLTRVARNGRVTHHPITFANSQAARRAAKHYYPGIRIERIL